MAESSSPQKPLHPPISIVDTIAAAGTPNPNLVSPQVHASPSMDLPRIPSPKLPQSQTPTSGTATPVGYASKQQMQRQQLQPSVQQNQQNLINSTSNFQFQAAAQRSGGSMPRISQLQQQFGPASASSAMRPHGGGIYGVQMNFGGQQLPQQSQQIGVVARQGMIAQAGQLSMLPEQSVSLQAQMLAQNRQKLNLVAGSQFFPANSSGTGLQGMQAMGLIGSLGMNSQIRENNALNYSQQRLGQAQIWPQSLPQQIPLTSPQKFSGQNLSGSASIATMNPQLPGVVQNGQALAQNAPVQQQWTKQMQQGISGPASSLYNIQQQKQQKQQTNFLPQRTSSSHMHLKQMGLTQQQLSQMVQQQNLLTNQQQRQQQLEQLQQLQQQQQQQQQQPSPRLSGNTLQKSLSLSGSEQNTTAATPSGSSGQATEAGSQLLGKRRIEELVSQVDSRAKLDPEIVDLLLEMADDFIDSVTTFACSLARHRKSSLLEAKDVLLHLEKNWQLKIPGYSRGEPQNQLKCLSTDIHDKQLAMIRTLMQSQLAAMKPGLNTPATHILNESSFNHPMKPSPSSEQLVLPTSSTQMMNKMARF